MTTVFLVIGYARHKYEEKKIIEEIPMRITTFGIYLYVRLVSENFMLDPRLVWWMYRFQRLGLVEGSVFKIKQNTNSKIFIDCT